ncbi:MAG TPA: 1-deoxy-D-xylulose-5-phosphate reductoisomerase [Lachnospiraceae bacterium]|nr:1-deoxy-D-xylulose-5-phosphate reductoisomerase [Lachnospiraceae bacterium]
MKEIAVFGSTGSIGTQTLDIVRANKDLKVSVIAAGSNIALAERQIREFLPKLCVIYDEAAADRLKKNIRDLSTKVLCGMEGMLEAAVLPQTDIVVTAMVGMIGIRPTIAAIKAKKDIALANKETLVTAGHLIMPLAKEQGVSILPIDSEHSAIFQSLNGENPERISKILLTASGGPFLGRKKSELAGITVEDALRHPNWSMGRKITVDSATLVNKGLEVMEARWLFGVGLDRIQVVVHPQSIIHSMVEYIDGAIIAQLGMPDMKLPIQYALFYPDRKMLDTKHVDFYSLQQMTFMEPDMETFSGLKMAFEAAAAGGTMPTVFNAANEKAVGLFLDKKIGFLDIYDMIRQSMEHHKTLQDPDVAQILAAEQETYEFIESRW